MQKQAVLKTIKRGQLKGQTYFRFIATNGKDVGGSTPETYEQKQSAIDTLTHNFPDFSIVDETDTIQEVVITD